MFGHIHDVVSQLLWILNYAARVLPRIPKSAKITSHLKSLHWLLVKVRSACKIANLGYRCNTSTVPSHVIDMLLKNHHTPATLTLAYTLCLFLVGLHAVRQHLVIACFLLLILLSITLLQTMLGVPHHCQNLSLA